FLLPHAPRPPSVPLFPYTTLFRSRGAETQRGRISLMNIRLNSVLRASVSPSPCVNPSRRSFLADVGMGFTGLALGAMLARDGVRSESTRLNSSHQIISYAVFCLKK